MDIRKYSRSYSDALKFSDGDHAAVKALMDEVAADPEHAQPGSHVRGVLADALDEVGRTAEGELARHPEHHVYVRNGKLYHAAGDPNQAGIFANHYVTNALRHLDPPHDFTVDDLHPDTLNQLYDDANHFYHSNHDLLVHSQTGQPATISGADNFWEVRNQYYPSWGHWERGNRWSDESRAYLHQDAEQAGPYLLTRGKDGLFHGESQGVSDWGQQPGINHERNNHNN